MVLHTFAATQQVPRHTRLHSRGCTRVLPTSRGAPFPPPSSRGGILSLCSGKNSRLSRCISRGGALHRKGERNSRVVPPFPESPKCLSPFQGNLFSLHCLDFQAEDQLTPRSTWDSPVGNPRGKPRWNATDSMIHSKESVTLMLQLGRKAHVHAPTRDED